VLGEATWTKERLARARQALPNPIAGADHWGELAFAAIDGEPVDVLYDRPRLPTWRTENL